MIFVFDLHFSYTPKFDRQIRRLYLCRRRRLNILGLKYRLFKRGLLFFLSPVRFCRNRSGNGETLKFPITSVTQQVIPEQNFWPNRRWTIAASDAWTVTSRTPLTNHLFSPSLFLYFYFRALFSAVSRNLSISRFIFSAAASLLMLCTFSRARKYSASL